MPRRHPPEPDTDAGLRAFEWAWTALAVAVPLVFVRESLFPYYHAKLFALQGGLLLMCVVWALRVRSGEAPVLPASPFTLPVLLFAALSALSVLQAVNRFEAVAQLGHRISVLLLFFVLAANVRRGRVARLLEPVVLTCVAVAVVGILQYAGLGFLSLPTFGMPSATLGYRNFAAMATIASIPLAFYLLNAARNGLQRAVWSTALVLLLTFLVCTRARGAWAGLIGATAAVGALYLYAGIRGRLRRDVPGSPLRFPVGVLAAGIAVAIGFSVLVHPQMGGAGLAAHSPEKVELVDAVDAALDAGADKDRFAMWGNTLDMIADHGLAGVGIGNWQFVYPAYDRGDVVWKGAIPRRPHNDYLWMAAQLGIPGLLAFLWIVWVALNRAARLSLDGSGPGGFWLPACLCAGALALLVHGVFSFPAERITAGTLYWGALGMLAALDRDETAPGRPVGARRRWPVHIAVALVALALWGTGRAIAFHRHYARADRLFARHDWAAVIAETQSALAYGPVDPQIYLQRGLAHYSLGDYAASVRDNQACLAYHPNLVNALNNLGMAYNAAEEYDLAVKTLMRLEELDPDHAEVHANMGMAMEGLSRLDEAASEYQQYLESHPENVGMRHRLGAVHLKSGRLDSAIVCFRQVLSAVPSYLPAQVALGETLVTTGDTAAAVASYRAFLQSGSPSPDAADMIRRRITELQDR